MFGDRGLNSYIGIPIRGPRSAAKTSILFRDRGLISYKNVHIRGPRFTDRRTDGRSAQFTNELGRSCVLTQASQHFAALLSNALWPFRPQTSQHCGRVCTHSSKPYYKPVVGTCIDQQLVIGRYCPNAKSLWVGSHCYVFTAARCKVLRLSTEIER